jgi:hypothetical protein
MHDRSIARVGGIVKIGSRDAGAMTSRRGRLE